MIYNHFDFHIMGAMLFFYQKSSRSSVLEFSDWIFCVLWDTVFDMLIFLHVRHRVIPPCLYTLFLQIMSMKCFIANDIWLVFL